MTPDNLAGADEEENETTHINKWAAENWDPYVKRSWSIGVHEDELKAQRILESLYPDLDVVAWQKIRKNVFLRVICTDRDRHTPRQIRPIFYFPFSANDNEMIKAMLLKTLEGSPPTREKLEEVLEFCNAPPTAIASLVETFHVPMESEYWVFPTQRPKIGRGSHRYPVNPNEAQDTWQPTKPQKKPTGEYEKSWRFKCKTCKQDLQIKHRKLLRIVHALDLNGIHSVDISRLP